MDISFLGKRNEVEDIWSFDFQKPMGFTFDAGDYVELSLAYPQSSLGGRRWLTLASPPHVEYVRFITIIPDSPSDFKSELYQLQPGNTATISPAIGTFNLPRSTKTKILWIAGGIGVTPFISMAQNIQHRDEKRDICMLYTAKPGKFIAQPELRAVTTQYETTSSRPNLQYISGVSSDYEERQVYISGPQNYCEKIYHELLEYGLKRNQLHLDYFPGYSQF